MLQREETRYGGGGYLTRWFTGDGANQPGFRARQMFCRQLCSVCGGVMHALSSTKACVCMCVTIGVHTRKQCSGEEATINTEGEICE